MEIKEFSVTEIVRKKIQICLFSPSLWQGIAAKKLPACVLAEMETGSSWGDLSRAVASLLYGPLHHQKEAVNPSWNGCAAAEMWFLSSDFATSLCSAEVMPIVVRNRLVVDLGSVWIEIRYVPGVAKYMKRTCPWCSLAVMWGYSDIWKAWFLWVGSVWFNADQLLDIIWWFVTARVLLLFGLLLRMKWVMSAKCMCADGFACASFILTIISSREVLFCWQHPAFG